MHLDETQMGEPDFATQAFLAEEVLRQLNVQEGQPAGVLVEAPEDALRAARGFAVAVIMATIFWAAIGLAVWWIFA